MTYFAIFTLLPLRHVHACTWLCATASEPAYVVALLRSYASNSLITTSTNTHGIRNIWTSNRSLSNYLSVPDFAR